MLLDSDMCTLCNNRWSSLASCHDAVCGSVLVDMLLRVMVVKGRRRMASSTEQRKDKARRGILVLGLDNQVGLAILRKLWFYCVPAHNVVAHLTSGEPCGMTSWPVPGTSILTKYSGEPTWHG